MWLEYTIPLRDLLGKGLPAVLFGASGKAETRVSKDDLWARGTDRLDSVRRLRDIATGIRRLSDQLIQPYRPAEAPALGGLLAVIAPAAISRDCAATQDPAARPAMSSGTK